MVLMPWLLFALVGVVIGEEIASLPDDEVWSTLYPSQKGDWPIYWQNQNNTNLYDEHDYVLDSYSASRGIEKPECFFEEFTGACCVRASIHGNNLRTCIEVAIQLSDMKASVVVHVNNKELLSKSIEKGQLCAHLPPPLPPTKVCLNTYYGRASWSQKTIDTCGALELGSLLHVRFDCMRFANGKFEHHADIQPEHYGLVNVYWQNGKPRFQIVSQPISENVRQWIVKQWTKIKNVFRQKSKSFVKWLSRKL